MAIWVKICGNTRVEDAEAAVSAGANAIGFVFAPSPRRIAALDVRTIVTRLPATLQRIGVFVNEKPERVREIVERAGLTGVQLHGDETPEYVQKLFAGDPRPEDVGYTSGRRRVTRLFKGIKMDDNAGEKLRRFAASGDHVDAFILDSSSDMRGGTGKTFDWDKAAAMMKEFPKLRFVIAGGLRFDNVAEAIRKMRPWGVDVSSGVEKQPGIKSEEALFKFVDAVRAAEKSV